MNFKENKLSKKVNKLKLALYTTPMMVSLMRLKVYAESTISTKEVEDATNNIKNAVVKLAMPIGSIQEIQIKELKV